MTKSSELIHINGIEIELIRSRRKSLSLGVGRQGRKVRVPLRMSKKLILAFIHNKQQWLDKQINNRPAPIKEKQLLSGTPLLFKSQPLTLNIIENQRGKVFIENDQLHLPVVKSNRPLQSTTKSKLITWYKQQALETLEQRIGHYATLMNVERTNEQKVKVREYKRRWGKLIIQLANYYGAQ